MFIVRQSMVRIHFRNKNFSFFPIFREVTHDIQDLQGACQDPDLFLESSRVEPMNGCSCPLLVNFIESDVRLCLDDLLDEVIVRTTVK